MRHTNETQREALASFLMVSVDHIRQTHKQAYQSILRKKPFLNERYCGQITVDKESVLRNYTIFTGHMHEFYKRKKLLPFTGLLAPESWDHWERIAARLQRHELGRIVTELSFRIDNKDVKAFTIVTWRASSGRFKIWFLAAADDKNLLSLPPDKPVLMHQRDYDTIVKVHRFILEHLLEQHTKPQLVTEVGTNLHKVKTGFRQLYGTSMHQFYIKKRMELAAHLITSMTLSLEDIADLCGYRTYHNFSSGFKNYYQFSPFLLRFSIPAPGDRI